MQKDSKGPSRTKLIVALVVIGAAIGAARFAGLGPFAPAGVDGRILLSGNIEAHQSILAFRSVQSTIVELPVEEGQWVEKDALLARLDDADYRQLVAIDEAALSMQERQLAAARQNVEAAGKTIERDAADLAQKELEFSRKQRLWQQHATATEERDLAASVLKQAQATLERDTALRSVAEENLAVADAAVRQAREQLEMSRITLSHTTLRAPFAGVVLVRQAELGEVMLPGTPVVTLADLDHVWLRAYVNEPDLGRIRLGQTVTLRTDTVPYKPYEGRIASIASKAEFTPKNVETHAERVMLVYRIKIDVANPHHELKPGMPADAVIDVSAAGAHG